MASLDERLNHLKYDLVVPVPLHKARVRSREYNQSEIISMEVARCLNIEHVADVLVRHRHTLQQAKLEEDKRWSNVENAFGVRNDGVGVLLAKRILLVDDIVTTGATVFEASKPLLRVGARQVDIFSLAYAI
jgi:ComF family protein